MPKEPQTTRRALSLPFRFSCVALALSVSAIFSPASLEGAVANGDTRAISIINVLTHESATVTFKRNGYYDAGGLKQLSWLLRDYRRNESIDMSPRLFDILWEVHQEAGSTQPFHALSGYRSPQTNAMLRRRSRLVAEHSQHMLGRAMDSFLPDVPVAKMRAIAMRLQMGGVGFYPTAGSPFVHIDAGGVRSWPRMSREQLVRLFPDGKTVHLPRDRHPLAGYEEAKAEILAHGGTVAGETTSVDPTAMAYAGTAAPHRSFWSTLFGGGGADDDEDRAEAAAMPRGHAAHQPVQVASNAPMTTNGDDNGAHALIMAQAQDRTEATPASTQVNARFDGQATPPASAAMEQPGTAAVSGMPAALRTDATAKAAGDAIAAFAPLPPRRPEALEEVAALVDIPTPPERPSLLDAPGAAAGADTGSLMALDAPLPPARPAIPAFAQADPMPTGSIAATAPGAHRVSSNERIRLDALFAAAALVPSHLPKVRIEVASTVRASLPGVAIREIVAPPAPAASHFATSGLGPRPNHFSGKAVVAPVSLGFTRTQ